MKFKKRILSVYGVFFNKSLNLLSKIYKLMLLTYYVQKQLNKLQTEFRSSPFGRLILRKLKDNWERREDGKELGQFTGYGSILRERYKLKKWEKYNYQVKKNEQS